MALLQKTVYLIREEVLVPMVTSSIIPRLSAPSSIISIILSLTLVLTGCSSSGPLTSMLTPSASSSIVPSSDPSDPCNSQVQAFQGTTSYFQQPLVIEQEDYTRLASGLATAFSGAITGSKGSLEYNMQQALKEFAGAAVEKTTKSYLMQLGQQASDRQQILGRIDSDAAADSAKLSDLRQEIAGLQACRSRQVNDIESRYKRRQITAEQARVEYQQAQSLIDRDNRFIEQLVSRSGERVNTYVEADYVVATGKGPDAYARSGSPQATGKKSGQKRQAAGGVRPRKGASSSIQRVANAQQQVQDEQQKVQELGNIIERKKKGLA